MVSDRESVASNNRSSGSTNNNSIAILLSIIGGALILTNALIILIWYYYMPLGMGMMMQWGGMHDSSMGIGTMGGWLWSWIGIPATMGIITGTLVMLGSIMLSHRPYEERIWGLLILTSSIVSLFGMGGFIIGSILGMLGGALILLRLD